MARWGAALPDADVQNVIAYVRTAEEVADRRGARRLCTARLRRRRARSARDAPRSPRAPRTEPAVAAAASRSALRASLRPERGLETRRLALAATWRSCATTRRSRARRSTSSRVRWREHGDVEAARQLVLSNLRLVVKIAMEYRRTWTNVLDLIQEGNLGLMQAVQRFDPDQGVKLSSYAAYWIRAYILKYLLDNIRLVRLGTTPRRAQALLPAEQGEARARAAGLRGRAAAARRAARRHRGRRRSTWSSASRESDLSFDAPLARRRRERTFGDLIAGGGAARPRTRSATRSCAASSSRRCTSSPRRSTSATAASSTSASWPRSRRRSRRWATSSASRASACASSRRASWRGCATT